MPDVARDGQQQAYVRALVALTKALDPTRPVAGNDGWEYVAGDIIGVHDYDADPDAIAARYGDDAGVAAMLARERPGRRALLADGAAYAGQPVMLTEFGGIALSRDAAATWGYSRAASGEDLGQRYGALVAAVHGIGMMSGSCYTQLTDTYQETNGLLYFDRTPKFPLEEIARATRGR